MSVLSTIGISLVLFVMLLYRFGSFFLQSTFNFRRGLTGRRTGPNMCILTGYFLVACLIPITMATQIDKDQALQAVSQGTNQFSSSLLQAVVEDYPRYLVMSPISAAIVLAMAAYGSRGETENQFKQVLHLPSSESLGTSGYQALIDTLNNIKENKLKLANKVFMAEQFSIKPTYQQLTENYFHSVTQSVNFAKSVEAANTINTWVKQNTNNLIDNIVTSGDLNGDTALVLVNAIYFKGQWKNKFNPELTKNMPFHINENTVNNVPTMYRQGSYKYGELPHLNAKFIEIPYQGNELSMIIILPNEINGLSEVEKKLQDTSMTDILNQGFEREVELYLPKFKIENKIDLNSYLQKLGLTDMFTSRANFSGIADANLVISKVVQKAFIEVNEEGSEAAAATGLLIEARCMVFRMAVMIDRPFLYSINLVVNRNTEDVVPLFIGHVTEPKST
ncbi:serine protease inhibitor 3/4 isoform X3 [Ptiloglossa arizonensis]|uniref:serine protease inhibitor 3/4 isoform X3 n=1 Tax=Ptiloglossa arizonensis TaxID=3350558 RepID=UPI003FA0E0F7